MFISAAMLPMLTGCFGLTDAMISNYDSICTSLTTRTQRDKYRHCMAERYEGFKASVNDTLNETN